MYEFGPFRLDSERELLFREGEPVAIAPKALQILLVLIRRAKQLVTKDELMQAIWPDTLVEEGNLSRNIFLLRKALGEGPQDRQYIVTVARRGYRFAQDVRLVAEGAVTGVAAQPELAWRWGWIAAATLSLIAAAGGAYVVLSQRAAAIGEARTVVLADFENSTRDPIFDGTLRQGLAVQLEQSPNLSLNWRRASPANASPDAQAGQYTTDAGDCRASLQTHEQRPRFGRFHRESRPPIRPWVESRQLR